MKTRKEERLTTNVASTARVPATPAEIRILDISRTGCKIATGNGHVQVGATILVQLAGNDEAAGQIAWKDGEVSGVRFHRAISLDAVDRTVAEGLG